MFKMWRLNGKYHRKTCEDGSGTGRLEQSGMIEQIFLLDIRKLLEEILFQLLPTESNNSYIKERLTMAGVSKERIKELTGRKD